MSLTTEGMTPADLAAVMGSNNGLGNGFGGDGWWIILLLLFANGGWGNGFNGGFGGYGNMMLGYDFPWLLNGQNAINANTNAGFQNAYLNDGITSIRDGIAGISTQICNTGSDMQMSLANGFAGVEQGANARQMANMNQMFANQTAMMQGFNNIQSQFADCCCENRLANCQTQNIIQNEGNATRFADANNTRDIIESQNRGTQSILDKLCQLELDGYKRENDNLRSQLQFANMQASQVEQTSQLRTSQATVANQLVSELRSCPIPSQPVYGNQPIFTQSTGSCGCGCGQY